MGKTMSLLFLILLFLGVSPVHAYAQDPWYQDVGSNQWFYPHVRVLWEEEVTDGRVNTVFGVTYSYYFPDEDMTRAQFATLLSKVFKCEPQTPLYPSYPDVPKNYEMLHAKRVWADLEGLLCADMGMVPPGQRFRPDDPVIREDAVWFLVKALGMINTADKMDPLEINSILRSFRDWNSVTENRRNAMACAIKFGIVDGYDDNTLKPARRLTRAEGATIVARSCMIRVNAEDEFSPDGDGIEDKLCIELEFLKNRGISSWQVSVFNQKDELVLSLNAENQKGEPPAQIFWDGTDKRGDEAPQATYYYQAYVWDRNGRSHMSLKKPVRLIRHSLSAALYPETVNIEDLYTVLADTSIKAQKITLTVAGKTYDMDQSGTLSWTKTLTAQDSSKISVRAEFPKCRREVTLYLNVIDPMWLIPSVTPQRALWGDILTLDATASQNIHRVSAHIFGISETLSKKQSSFTAGLSVPEDIPIGIYTCTFIGYGENRSIEREVSVQIGVDELLNLRFILVK